MAYLVLAVIVLLAIGALATAVLARDHWRWFHITAASTIAVLAALFPFYTAGALKSRAAWNQQYDQSRTRLVRARAETRELKGGGTGAGVVELAQDLTREQLDAGRRWQNLVPQGRQQNRITLRRKPTAADAGAGVPGVPEATDEGEEDPVAAAPMIPVDAVVYAFGEQMDPETQIPVPSSYLGEYKVVQATPESVVIEPVAALNQAQEAGVQNAPQWTLYELLPLDSHFAFLAPGSTPTDDNVLGRIDDALVQRTLANRVTAQTLQKYLDDGRRSQPDDPPLSRWMKVELVKPYTIDVDDVRFTAPVTSGGYFDGTGRALDIRLKRVGDEDGSVEFRVGEQLLLTEQAGSELIDDGTAKLIDRFYLRPLNDYRFILRRIQLEVAELRSRIEELQFEGKVLQDSIERTAGLIVIQQTRKNQLEQDLAQFKIETTAVNAAVEESTASVKQTREAIRQLHRDNLALEQKLEGFHAAITQSLR